MRRPRWKFLVLMQDLRRIEIGMRSGVILWCDIRVSVLRAPLRFRVLAWWWSRVRRWGVVGFLRGFGGGFGGTVVAVDGRERVNMVDSGLAREMV